MIILFIGQMGSGKTLSMTRSLLQDSERGKALFVNYGIKFGKPTYLTSAFFKNYKNFQVTNASIGVDEIHVFIDSRSSQSKKNKMFTRFITQSRKRSVTLYCTTQHFRQVDVRLRNLADVLVECRSFRIKGKHYVKNTLWVPYGLGFKVRRVYMFEAGGLYSQYDTNEIIDISEDD